MSNGPKWEFIALHKAKAGYVFGPYADEAEAGRRIKRIVEACIFGKRGVDELADDAMDREEGYREQQKDAAAARWGRGGNAVHTPKDAAHIQKNAAHSGKDANKKN